MNNLTLPGQWRGLRPHRLLARLDEEPRTGSALHALGRALLGTLDGRSAETIALRVSAARDCRYVWQGHSQIATRHPTDPRSVEEIARIAAGAEALEGADADLVRAIDALLARDGTAGRPPLEVVVATFFYDLLTVLLHDAEPEADVRPLPGLETPAAARRWLNERS